MHLPDGHTKYWGNNYVYDAWGNLLQKTVTKCSSENLSVSALANNRLAGYAYDTAGNLLNDGLHQYSYDAESRIRQVDGGAATYTYDAEGQRVRKDTSPDSGSTEYIYLGGNVIAESTVQTGGWTNYVFFNGKRVARKDFPSGAVSYYFSDNLKTADLITDSAGAIKAESDYYPFGGELPLVNNDSNHYKHNGKERDAETGLDYYGARHYSPSLSRFITPDWSLVPVPVPYADLTNPQTLNQYIFAHNNPTSLDDPDGHCPVCVAVPAGAPISVSGAFWGAGSVALPGVLGGGLAHYGSIPLLEIEISNPMLLLRVFTPRINCT